MLIEYGYSGCPVVATNVGGNKEVIIHGKTGYLVSSENPKSMASFILDLLKNKEKRLEFGRNSKEFVNIKFDKNNIIELYQRLYCQITGYL